MKIILFCILIANSLWGFSQSMPKNVILWDSERLLEWSDFKGNPAYLYGSQAASVMSGIEMTVDFSESYTQCVVKVVAYMEPKKSAKRKESSGEFLLKHEQLHFDITEWYARKMRKEISELRVPLNKIGKECTKIFTRLNRDLSNQQKAYDRETNHSINKLEQEKWNKKVANALKELEEFKNIEIVLKEI